MLYPNCGMSATRAIKTLEEWAALLDERRRLIADSQGSRSDHCATARLAKS